VIRKTLVILSTSVAVLAVLLWWHHAGDDQPFRRREFNTHNGTISVATNGGSFYVNWYAYFKEERVRGKNVTILDFPLRARVGDRIRLFKQYAAVKHPDYADCNAVRYVFFHSPVAYLWFIIAMFLIPPGFSLIRGPLRRWRRRRKGLCGSCGYDLTGNESGTCPECGKATGIANS
jgi:hypothetical protein